MLLMSIWFLALNWRFWHDARQISVSKDNDPFNPAHFGRARQPRQRCRFSSALWMLGHCETCGSSLPSIVHSTADGSIRRQKEFYLTPTMLSVQNEALARAGATTTSIESLGCGVVGPSLGLHLINRTDKALPRAFCSVGYSGTRPGSISFTGLHTCTSTTSLPPNIQNPCKTCARPKIAT